jgi:hypothetical protein
MWDIEGFPVFYVDMEIVVGTGKGNVSPFGQALKVALDRPQRVTGIFPNLGQPSPGNTGLAIGIGEKIQVHPDTRSHRLAVLAFGIGYEPVPDRCPPFRSLPCTAANEFLNLVIGRLKKI